MKKLLYAALAASSLMVAAKGSKDPVLMTVDGTPVTQSEFEYLYHKNANQQVDQQSLDEYLDMFTVYKLKVADARRHRVDTVSGFQQEFAGYRRELAQPYLTDSALINKMAEETYARMHEQVEINHLMVKPDDVALADSLRKIIVDGGEDFISVAERFTTDPSFVNNHGYYGFVSAAQSYPYEFIDGVYNTPVGEVSPVITTRFGRHLVQVKSRRQEPPQIHARHILVGNPLTTITDSTRQVQRQTVDSLYQLLLDGADFAEVARKNSTCPSRQQGGDLGWFGAGTMVKEFEDHAYALKDGEISKPFQTRFGWHIVQRLETREEETYEQAKPAILKAMESDGRSDLAVKSKVDALAKEYKAQVVDAGKNAVHNTLALYGGYEKAADKIAADKTKLIVCGDSTLTVADVFAVQPQFAPGETETTQVDNFIDDRFRQVVLDYETARLASKYPEFRLLSNEYYDGMMLFERSNATVWGRPAADPEGLEAYFQANREKFSTWDAPRYKGYIIYATSDSLVQEVNKYLEANQPAADAVGEELKAAFPKNIKIERVVLPQGKNALVDYLAFGGEAYTPKEGSRWVAYTTYLGHVIDQPENAADVRGAVSSDWQTQLEAQWVDELRSLYPVTVNKKVLKKVK